MSKLPINFSKSGKLPDVEVDILGQIYHVHSTVLRLNSGFFDKGLSDTWWKPENTHTDHINGLKYRYRLVIDKSDITCSFVEPFGPGAISATNTQYFTQKERLDLAATYNQLFGLLYSRPFKNKHATRGSEDYIQNLIQLLSLADAYQALPTIAPKVHTELISWWFTDKTVYFSKVKLLKNLLTIAVKIKSRGIYNDVYVHLVGMHLHSKGSLYLAMETMDIPEDLRYIIEKESRRIMTIQLYAERRVSRFKDEYIKQKDLFISGYNLHAHHPSCIRNYYSTIVGLGLNHGIIPEFSELLSVNVEYLKNPGERYKYLMCAKKLEDEDFPWSVEADGDLEDGEDGHEDSGYDESDR